MRIAHFNSEEAGGSAVLMNRLDRALVALGHDSRAYHKSSSSAIDCKGVAVCGSENAAKLLERAGYSFENRLRRADARSYFSKMHLAHKTVVHDSLIDIAHLHWVGILASSGAPSPKIKARVFGRTWATR